MSSCEVRRWHGIAGLLSRSMAKEATIAFVGGCYQCRTATPPKLSNAVIKTSVPRSGVVTVCILCDECRADSMASQWDKWMRRGSPPPSPVAGRLLVQVVGVCLTCLNPMTSVADYTGVSGQRMTPTTCSSECEVEARREYDL
jgi:hypothetical protein